MSTSSKLEAQGTSFNIALIQLGGIGSDKPANLLNARTKIAEARAREQPRAQAASGNRVARIEGLRLDVEGCASPSIKMLSSVAKEEQVWLFGGSIPERSPDDPKVLYNSAPVFQPDGKLVALHRKLHLFDIDIPNQITFKESETLSAGRAPVTIVETPFGKIGLGICYDIRFPEMAMIAARKGCIAMIYPGAFNLTTGPCTGSCYKGHGLSIILSMWQRVHRRAIHRVIIKLGDTQVSLIQWAV
ncbi:hypothetical protein KEM48_006372 [Puccinia striiformis f. sp. tritici PST-130]|nr:hypothetical protein KEM48_006372 [Puccinia striiformis f. sp. tritici PST-130]